MSINTTGGKLILVRHGQSLWNLENRFTGWVDIAITEQGMAEARAAGERLKHLRVDVALTSTLQRAHQTLDLILETTNHTHLTPEKHDALNERHYGDLQGLNKAEVAKQYGDEQVRLWRRSYDVQPPGGESLADTVRRVRPYLMERILPATATQNILVVAHGNSLRAICMQLEQLSPEDVVKLEIGHCEPWVYDIHTNGTVLGKEKLV